MARRPLIERLLDRVTRIPFSGCWIWEGYLDKDGYGQIYEGPGMRLVHRASYMLLVGPIPKGLTIDHLCRVRCCVNPEHMEPVTVRENTMRGTATSVAHARATECVRGHPFDAVNTRLYQGHRACRACSRLYAYLPELLALGAVQVVWGGNYYALPVSRGWLSWYKPDAPPSMGNVELAWTNLDRNQRQIICSISETNQERVGHPTQKPLKVMRWCIDQVGNPDIILDPFMGSGSTGVAAIQNGRKFVGVEIHEPYFQLACERIENAQRQERLFA